MLICAETSRPPQEKAEGRKPPKLTSDAERVAFLFERYQALTSLLPAEKPKRISRKRSRA